MSLSYKVLLTITLHDLSIMFLFLTEIIRVSAFIVQYSGIISQIPVKLPLLFTLLRNVYKFTFSIYECVFFIFFICSYMYCFISFFLYVCFYNAWPKLKTSLCTEFAIHVKYFQNTKKNKKNKKRLSKDISFCKDGMTYLVSLCECRQLGIDVNLHQIHLILFCTAQRRS